MFKVVTIKCQVSEHVEEDSFVGGLNEKIFIFAREQQTQDSEQSFFLHISFTNTTEYEYMRHIFWTADERLNRRKILAVSTQL